LSESRKHPRYEIRKSSSKPVTSFTANASDTIANCSLCKTQKHPLYVCPQFRSLPHDKMLTMVRSNNLCLNCLKPGHCSVFVG